MRKMGMMCLMMLLAICLTGCQRSSAPSSNNDFAGLEAYVADIRAQSDAIRASLEKEALTQTDMNQKSGELRSLWDDALAHVLAEAEAGLAAADMEKLTAEQNGWLHSREVAVEAAGKDAAGGSLYALAVNLESAALTEKRVYEVLEQLKSRQDRHIP